MTSFVREHPVLVGWATGLSLLLLVGTLVVVPLVLARIAPDHFTRVTLPPASLRSRRPGLALAGRLLKNLLGALLVLAGIAMLILPGQGLLTILMGLALVDFPGRRRLMLTILRERHVHHAIDRIRARAGRPPLDLGQK